MDKKEQVAYYQKIMNNDKKQPIKFRLKHFLLYTLFFGVAPIVVNYFLGTEAAIILGVFYTLPFTIVVFILIVAALTFKNYRKEWLAQKKQEEKPVK